MPDLAMDEHGGEPQGLRIYSTAGYNIAHIEITARLCEEHNIRYGDIDRIEALVNWFETEYPSPLFPTPGSDGRPRVGSTQYFAAWGAAMRGYPLRRGAAPGPGESDPPEVLELMHRVTLIPVVRRTLFGPRVTIFTKDGRSVTKDSAGVACCATARRRMRLQENPCQMGTFFILLVFRVAEDGIPSQR